MGTTHCLSPSFPGAPGSDGHSSSAGQAGRTCGVPRAQHSAIPNPPSKDTHFIDEEAEVQAVEPGMAGPRPGELDSAGPSTPASSAHLFCWRESRELPSLPPGHWAVP